MQTSQQRFESSGGSGGESKTLDRRDGGGEDAPLWDRCNMRTLFNQWHATFTDVQSVIQKNAYNRRFDDERQAFLLSQSINYRNSLQSSTFSAYSQITTRMFGDMRSMKNEGFLSAFRGLHGNGGGGDSHRSLMAILKGSQQIIARELKSRQAFYAANNNITAPLKRYAEELDRLLVFAIADSVWHLIEVLFLNPDRFVTKLFVEWNRQQMLKVVDTSLSGPSDEASCSDYWAKIQRLVFLGYMAEAKACLIHAPQVSAFVHDDPGIREKLITLIAAYEGMVGLSSSPRSLPGDRDVDALKLQFTTWRASCLQLMKGIENMDIYTLLRILTGEEELLAHMSGNWMEFLISRLLFQSPFLLRNLDDLAVLAEECVAALSGHGRGGMGGAQHHVQGDGKDDDRTDMYDQCCQSILIENVVRTVHLCHSELDLPCVTVHLADLLAHAGFFNVEIDTEENVDEGQDSGVDEVEDRRRADKWELEPAAAKEAMEDPKKTKKTKTGADLLKSYFVKYCDSIVASADLWQLLPEYLGYCGIAGFPNAQIVVDGAPMESDRSVLKVSAFCKNLAGTIATTAVDGDAEAAMYQAQVLELEQAVFAKAGFAALAQKHYGRAIFWFAKMRGNTAAENINFVCEELMRSVDADRVEGLLNLAQVLEVLHPVWKWEQDMKRDGRNLPASHAHIDRQYLTFCFKVYELCAAFREAQTAHARGMGRPGEGHGQGSEKDDHSLVVALLDKALHGLVGVVRSQMAPKRWRLLLVLEVVSILRFCQEIGVGADRDSAITHSVDFFGGFADGSGHMADRDPLAGFAILPRSDILELMNCLEDLVQSHQNYTKQEGAECELIRARGVLLSFLDQAN